MKIESYKDLHVWQKAIILVTDPYEISKQFPEAEKFGSTSQLRRSAISVPSNIAEGYGRNSTKSYAACLKMSRGSLLEFETQLIIANKLEYLEENNFITLSQKITGINKMLNSLIYSLEKAIIN